MGSALAGWRILKHLGPDFLIVFRLVVGEEHVRLALRGGGRVGRVQKVLYAEKDLLDGDGGPPPVVFGEDAKAHGAGGVDVGMEETRGELALGGLAGVILRELHGQGVEPEVPQRVLLSRNLTHPLEKVHRPARMATTARARKERKE